ncbi:hypothetical protein OE88DRAFT_1654316 [Heliocybe sulcata]|uniref:F-box domain-containing protein n=1 Tax=Heliocybe sulcata TaxID=5364 RepID=A0A5C3N862_9AGAM|nr:hypothetical protein OE88DRAFT_1654316 [Heliocybe sulcata]
MNPCSNKAVAATYKPSLELILDIFDTAAASSRASALSISSVCSWARVSVTEILSTSFILTGQSNVLRSIPENTRSPARNLWIHDVGESWLHARQFFLGFPEPAAVALSAHYLIALLQDVLKREESDGSINVPSPRHPCRSLSFLSEMGEGSWRNFVMSSWHPFRLGIAHMRFHHLRLHLFVQLVHFPNLTHLALPYADFTPDDPPLLDSCNQIPQALRFYVESRRHTHDIDMIHVVYAGREPSSEEWWKEVNGGRSIWNTAVPLDRAIQGILPV